MSKRAVIYARYSTDLQNDQSVEDQIRLCAGHAQKLGLTVVGEYHDRAKSGASMFGRPGLASMMQAVDLGAFDAVIAEATDRLSRDIADLGHIHKILTFRGIELQCVNGGRIDTMQVGLYGLVGQMQREEGAKKVRRGMVGVVRSGRSAGGKSYGYRPVVGEPGELEIVPEEAAVIRRIFDLYRMGSSPKSIAAILNLESVAPPRGIKWNSSTINGNNQRGNGILRNPLYSGKLIWNRIRMVKDPSTGRRISRINAESEHERQDMPHLQIIEQELFEAVQERKNARGGEHAHKNPKSKRLLSGLLRCAACGGGMGMIGTDRSGPRIMCSNNRESSSCHNSARYYVDRIERQVLDTLRRQFADTAIIDAYVTEYTLQRRRLEAEARRNRGITEKALSDVKEAIQRTVEQSVRAIISEQEATVILPSLRAERDRLEKEISALSTPTNVIEIEPKAVMRFRENIENLSQIVGSKHAEPAIEIAYAFRQLVAAIVVHPRKKGEPYIIEIKGYLNSLINSDMSARMLVAGEGLEPPTRGL